MRLAFAAKPNLARPDNQFDSVLRIYSIFLRISSGFFPSIL
jgi:hypothetical protein